MNSLDRLVAIEGIKAVKARYCRFVDTRQWDALRDLFTETATFHDQSGAMGDVANLDIFIAAVRAGLNGCISVHHIHAAEIEVTSDITASAIWAMEDRLLWEQGSGSPLRSLHGMGHYVERFERIGGTWKITAWALTRLRVDPVPA